MDMSATNWREQLKSKVAEAEEAIRLIPPGRRILIGSGAAEPVSLVQTMVEKGLHLADNEIVHLLTLGPAPYVSAEFRQRFRHTAFFIGPNVRQAVQDGRADFMPVFLSEIPGLIRSRRVRIDVALIQVSPPDVRGYVSLGVSVDIVRAAVSSAELILAEVNPHMPRTHGNSFIHVRDIHRLIPVDIPLLERQPEPADEVSAEIGRHVASLIPNGATLQVGIGRIPDAILTSLKNHRDLGVHTEMLSEGVMTLAEAGIINGRCKTLLPGKMVTSFVMGTRSLYEWVDHHPAVEMRGSDFTNDPFIIARNNQMVAINGALAVDLTGQVASDTLGSSFFSGVGGQVDFIRGAARSPGGKAIIALPSCAKNGTVSRIQAVFETGYGVVTSRADVRYVVTEYGVADLWGKNIRERAVALVSVAHPDFRRELLAAAKNRRFIFPDQVLPSANYVWAEQRIEKLPSGAELAIRPVRITDEKAIQDLLYSLSDESIYRRFLGMKHSHPHEEIQTLVNLDIEQNMALVACLPEQGEIIGLARYDVNPATSLADVAFVVRDTWQGQGIGTILMRRMKAIATARGLAGFELDVLATNKPMLVIVQKSGLKVRSQLDTGTYHLEARFQPAET